VTVTRRPGRITVTVTRRSESLAVTAGYYDAAVISPAVSLAVARI
jgi:hypothetical protein